MKKNFKNGVKRMSAALLCGIMITGLTACGASNGAMSESMDVAVSEDVWYATTTVTKNDSAWYDSYVEVDSTYSVSGELKSVVGTESGEDTLVTDSARKVIKTARLNLQTLDFDAFVQALDGKINEMGAYLQYADVSGSSYYGGRKSANYTIRVPQENLNAFLTGIEGIANVTSKTLGEEDVTLSYVDVESHIKTLEIEQERLLSLLEKAEDLDSIIKLEERLSEVRYSIESYEAKLRTYDDKITYSTVYIYVYEVTRVTEQTPKTLLERIQNGWSDTMYEIATGAEDFLVWFVVNIPYLVFWAAVVVVLVVLMKKGKAKRLEKKIDKQRENNETKLDNQE